METLLQAELEEDLGYAKHDSENKVTDNSRNGSSTKTFRSEYGDVQVDAQSIIQSGQKVWFVKGLSTLQLASI